MRAAADPLQERGLPLQQIGDAIGMPAGSLRTIISAKKGPERVREARYATLIRLARE